jgi:hypothetical protein
VWSVCLCASACPVCPVCVPAPPVSFYRYREPITEPCLRALDADGVWVPKREGRVLSRRARFVLEAYRMAALHSWDAHVLGIPRPANTLVWAWLFIKVNRCNSLPSPLVPEAMIQAYAREVYGTGGAMPDFSTKQFLYSDQALNHSYAKAYVRWMFPNLSHDLSTCFVFTALGDQSCRRTMWPELYPPHYWADNEGLLLYNPSFRGNWSRNNWNSPKITHGWR